MESAILGTLLFLLFKNDLPNYLRSLNRECMPTIKSITYASSDINDINKRLNYDLIKVYVLIDWWSAWVHSLDCLVVIYKLSKLIFQFLKTSSRTEVLNKGVLLNWMDASYIQLSFGERKFSLWLDYCTIWDKKTLSKFLTKIYYF